VQPLQVRLGASQPEISLAQALQRAIVQHLAGSITPRRVKHLPNPAARHIARDYAVQQPQCIRPANCIFIQRRNIEQRGTGAHCKILALGLQLIRARHQARAPAAPVLRSTQRRSAGMERCTGQHAALYNCRVLMETLFMEQSF